jgi:hypothetical protein
MDANLDQAKQAILALSNPATSKQADDWLISFEKSFHAWQTAEQLLLCSNNDLNDCTFQFFGAKFLYSKISRQFVQLDQDSANSLLPKLIQILVSFSRSLGNVNKNAITYLCLAISALALQLNVDGIIHQILLWLNGLIDEGKHSVILSLLTVLPEEVHNSRILINNTTRSSYLQQLAGSSSMVMDFLASLLASLTVSVSSSSRISLKEEKVNILKCGKNWFEILNEGSYSPQFTPSHYSVIQFALESLIVSLQGDEEEDELFDTSSDLIIVFMRNNRVKDPQIVESIIRTVVSLRNGWNSAILSYSKDLLDQELHNRCLNFSRLFTEVAESCLESLLSREGMMGQDELISQLIECSSFKEDHSIARIPLKFFYEAALCIRDPLLNTGLDPDDLDNYEDQKYGGNEENRLFLKNKYSSVYKRLLQIALDSIAINDNNQLLSNQLPPEKMDARLEWKESLLDICDVLSVQTTIEELCISLENEIKSASSSSSSSSNGSPSMNWSKIESIILAITFIISSTSHLTSHQSNSNNGSSTSYVPQLIGLISQLPSNLIALQITAIDLLGSLSTWLFHNPNYLHPVLTKLIHDLRNISCCESSSKSIRKIFSCCGKLQSLPLNETHQQLILLMNSSCSSQSHASEGEITTIQETINNLVEGMIAAVSFYPSEQAEIIFKGVLHEQILKINEILAVSSSDLAAAASSSSTPFYHSPYRIVIRLLDQMAIAFKHFSRQEQFIPIVFMEIFPILQLILARFPKENTCEKVCRIYKFGIKASGTFFANFLESFLGIIASQFATFSVSAFLYAGSICVGNFAHIQSSKYDAMLYRFLWSVSQTLFNKFQKVEQIKQDPEVIEEYFYLVAKFLQYSPQLFLDSSSEALAILDLGISCLLSLNHREAQKGILSFFQRLVNVPSFWSDSSPYSRRANELVSSLSPKVVSTLIQMLSGSAAPVYALDEKGGSISDVLWDLRKRSLSDFQVSSFSLHRSLVSFFFPFTVLGTTSCSESEE